MVSKKIKDVLDLFSSQDIIRVHQSFLININYVKEYIKNEGYYLKLDNNITIPVSKPNRTYLLDVIQKNT